MLIAIKKFGTTLVSRSAGKEAFLAFQPVLNTLKSGETIEVDFGGVIALGPSWTDEFLTPLLKKYKNRVTVLHTENPSVKATLEILVEMGGVEPPCKDKSRPRLPSVVTPDFSTRRIKG